MDNHINGWDELARQQFMESRRAFEARHDFAELMAEAAKRGYRRITLSEQMETGSANAYTWRGGVWVPAPALPA